MLGSTRRKDQAPEEYGIDMGPMMDMTFLLLIFFIVNVNFTKETGVQVKRPEASTGAPLATEGGAVITISMAGAVYFGPDRVDMGAIRPLMAKHRQQFPDGEVIVVADQSVPARLMVEVIDQCRLAGVKEINISTRTGAE